ncbi:hypothetical protein AOA60_28685 [Pseudomonas sp. 2822-17]|nr:hypothetical protein AOA60_28685 [Pseudomonas sp. 2822-17]
MGVQTRFGIRTASRTIPNEVVVTQFGIVQRFIGQFIQSLLCPMVAPIVEPGGESTQIDIGVLADFFQNMLSDNSHSLGRMREGMSDQLQIILIQFHGFGGS